MPEGEKARKEPEHAGKDDRLGNAPFESIQQDEGDNADADIYRRDTEKTACIVGDTERNGDGDEDADTEGADTVQRAFNEAVAAEAMDKDRREQRECERGRDDTEGRTDGAEDAACAHAGKGRAVEAERTGGHFGDRDDIRYLLRRHPAVRGHLLIDERHHRESAETRKADHQKGKKKLNVDHDVNAPPTERFRSPLR